MKHRETRRTPGQVLRRTPGSIRARDNAVAPLPGKRKPQENNKPFNGYIHSSFFVSLATPRDYIRYPPP